MKIIGFNFTKISIEREEKSQTNLNINQNINIKDVKKEKIPISEAEVIQLKFNLSINYSEDYAKLEFEGTVLILPEKEELKQVLESWKDKKIPEELRIPIFNFIMNKCNIKALYLEDELSLPLHLQNFMPRISSKKQEEQK